MWLTLPRTSLGFWVQLSFWVKWVCCCVIFQDNLGSTFLCVDYFILLYFISFQEQFRSNFLWCVILCISRAIFQYTNTYPKNLNLKPNRPSWKWISSFGDNDYSPVLFIRWGASQVQFLFFCNEPILLAHHSKKLETMEGPQHRRFYFEVQSASPLGSWCLDTLLLELILICSHVTHWNSSMILDRCWAQV